MSSVYVSRGKDGTATLDVRIGDAMIVIAELRVRPMSNTRTPHQLMGRGGSSIALTDEQFVTLVAEYLRFALLDPVDVKHNYVGWSFACKFDSKVEHDEIVLS